MWKGGTCIVLKATYNSSLQLPLSKIFQFLPILNEIREKKIAGLSGFPEWSSECVSADPLRMVSQQIRNVLLPNKCGIKETTDVIAAKKHISALWLCVLNQPFFTVFQYNALWQQTTPMHAHVWTHSHKRTVFVVSPQGADVVQIPRGPHRTRGVQWWRRQEVRPLQYTQLPEESTHSSRHIQWNAGILTDSGSGDLFYLAKQIHSSFIFNPSSPSTCYYLLNISW